MNQFNIKKIKIIQDVPPVGTKDDRWACDTEWYGMDDKRLHRPTGSFASLAATRDGKTVYIITDKTDIKKFLKNIDAGVHIWQNGKFDIFHIRRLAKYPERKRMWDTLYIEQILWSGYYDSFSLQDMVRRYLNIHMPKEVRKEFATSKTMSKEQLEYAAIDVVATWMVYQEQKKLMTEELLNVWRDIDMPALWVILSMRGVRLDVPRWKKMAKDNKARADAIQKKYFGLNLNSSQQVKKEFQKLGYKDIESTGKDFLRKNKDCEFAVDLQEFRTYAKRASTYGELFADEWVEADGLMYGDWRLIGTETGRFSCSSPNLQNVPKRNANEFRECYIAGEGNVYVIADWSSQEPRVATWFSHDEKLLDIFVNGKDIYCSAAHEMGEEITKKDARRNSVYKPVVLGASYGLTEFGLEEKYDVPLEEGKQHLEEFFAAFPTFAKWKREQENTEEDYVTTIYGRRFWLNKYNYQWHKNAINAPIQGSGGDAMKVAAARVVEEWDGYNPIVLAVHDELVIEVPEDVAEYAAAKLAKIMVEIAEDMHDGVPAGVEVKIGKSWGKAEVFEWEKELA